MEQYTAPVHLNAHFEFDVDMSATSIQELKLPGPYFFDPI